MHFILLLLKFLKEKCGKKRRNIILKHWTNHYDEDFHRLRYAAHQHLAIFYVSQSAVKIRPCLIAA